MKSAPFPKNEIARIMALSDLNIDYSNLNETFSDLTKLAAKVTGSPISLVNLIDNYTVWTVSRYGMEVEQTPREESVCQFTVLEAEKYEVTDMEVHENFKDAPFVTGDPHFRFYCGVPLRTNDQNLGALCVLDHTSKTLPAEKIEMLKIISDEIINRLKTFQYIDNLKTKVSEVKQTQNKVVHDIRGPIAGIMGLAEIIAMRGNENSIDEVLDFVSMIYKGGKSVLDLADEILTEEKRARANANSNDMALITFKKKLEQLYVPQARSKNIELRFNMDAATTEASFPQNKLMQIAGNLISNAIKFTPKYGDVTVTLRVEQTEDSSTLTITVTDTGAGISAEQIEKLLADNTESTDGTDGETGYGFGLALVKHLIKGLNGTFAITSAVDKGSQFIATIPFANQKK